MTATLARRFISFRGIATAMVLAPVLIACTSIHTPVARLPTRASLPVFPGWYAGERIYYITTEISDPQMARSAGANFAPRLRDAVPPYPRPPDRPTVLERVYKFPQSDQDAVFASAPKPLGSRSLDESYSPLWITYLVTWNASVHKRPLTSENMVLDAQSAGDVTVARTDIVINCPIIATAAGDMLPNVELSP